MTTCETPPARSTSCSPSWSASPASASSCSRRRTRDASPSIAQSPDRDPQPPGLERPALLVENDDDVRCLEAEEPGRGAAGPEPVAGGAGAAVDVEGALAPPA